MTMEKLRWLLLPLVFIVSFLSSYYLSPLFIPQEAESIEMTKAHHIDIIGFLPYWLLDTANDDYSPYLTNISYFGLAVDGDGSIYKKSEAQESEPGYYKFISSDLNQRLSQARDRGLETSLLIYAADNDAIDEMILHPTESAENLISELIPMMKEYGYNDLNVDLETLRLATVEEQQAFTQFLKIVSERVKDENFTLTICLPVMAFSYDTIIDPISIQPLVDKIVIMTYDYFYRGSFYTGPNAPVDEVESALQSVLASFESTQVILGIPLYSYQWETLSDATGSATIPDSGVTLSQIKLTKLLVDCPDCQYQTDEKTSETAVIYPDLETGSYFQTYMPDESYYSKKIELVKKYHLAGVAFWALGYENEANLIPFIELKNYSWQE